ncbi:MAG: class II aldolase/adducin family protein [Campylobacteraceae bacterium]|nr:class II aldolase/adducin family protein [Campylobacteraceae bacterium]
MSRLSISKEIIETCLKMESLGINQGTSGNISHRFKDGILITPSGISYNLLKPKDIVFVPFSSKEDYDGEYPPSSELDFHFDILKAKPDVNCVLHNHSANATAMAICGMDIPAHHYMVAVAGGYKIPCAPYATFGTQELSQNIIKVLDGYKACLLANHGVVTVGENLKKALWIAIEVENLAKQYILAKQVGEPKILSNKEMDKILKLFKSYGMKK